MSIRNLIFGLEWVEINTNVAKNQVKMGLEYGNKGENGLKCVKIGQKWVFNTF